MWANALSLLYINTTKPALDLILFTRKLKQHVGWQGIVMTFWWYIVSGLILRKISPSFGKLTAIEQQLEGEYRSLHTKLLEHSEEIAFYNGAEWEKRSIDASFDRLYRHVDSVLLKKFWMGIFDSMLVKYGAVMVGYMVVGLPVFGPGSAAYLAKHNHDMAQITKDYVRNSGLLINLSKAIGKIIVSYKEVQNLAGYTTQIWQMEDALQDLHNLKYRRVMLSKEEGTSNEEKIMSTKGNAKFTQGN